MTHRKAFVELPAVIAAAGLAWLTATPVVSGATEKKAAPAAETGSRIGEEEPDPIPASSSHWSRFRGEGGNGIAPPGRYPTEFDEASGVNIDWKVPVSLPGASSPIVWKDRVFLTGANASARAVFCFDAETGEALWTRPVAIGKKPSQRETWEGQTFAASTMVTDGERVFAIFGNGDLVALNFEGEILWSKGIENPITLYGYSTSPVLYENLLIVQLDQGYGDSARSRLMALDKVTGDPVWEKSGEEYPVSDSWSSPIIVRTEAGDQLVTRGGGWLLSRDPKTGALNWKHESKTGDISTSPIFTDGLIISSGYGGRTDALRPDGELAWSNDDSLAEIASPVAAGGLVFNFPGHDGYVTGIDLKTGQTVFEHFFEEDEGDGGFYASPVAVGNLIYALREDGVLVVFRAEREGARYWYRRIGLGTLKDQENCWATPAFANDSIYLRSGTHLYRIRAGDRSRESR